jgi:hypothetical protein
MNIGDLVKATWPDGLEIVGVYVREERGYIILKKKFSKEIPCSKHSVTFEVIDNKENNILNKIYSFFTKK